MKIKIQSQSLSQSESQEFIVTIPDSVNIKKLSVGEKFKVLLDNEWHEACYLADGRSLMVGNDIIRLSNKHSNLKYEASIIRPVEPKRTKVKKGFGELKSPMTGKVISVSVKNEDVVKSGDVLLIIEAMKMENRILAEVDGLVKNIKVTAGVNITAGEPLLTLTSKET